MTCRRMALPFPSRNEFRDARTGKLDVPRLDFALMKMLAQSGLSHHEFFAQMCSFYQFPADSGPFTNADVLLKAKNCFSARFAAMFLTTSTGLPGDDRNISSTHAGAERLWNHSRHERCRHAGHRVRPAGGYLTQFSPCCASQSRDKLIESRCDIEHRNGCACQIVNIMMTRTASQPARK